MPPHSTHNEEAVEAPRCSIWWHLVIVFGLIGAALVGLGSGWLYNANLGRCNESEIRVMQMKQANQDRDIDEIKADLKELLRRTPPTRISAGGQP